MSKTAFLPLVLRAALLATTAQAGPSRNPACVAANDLVTRLRIGKDRLGKPSAVDAAGAVAAGNTNAVACRGDDGFLLAYSLARIDLASDTKRQSLPARNAMFNAALADLEAIRSSVQAGRSDRYEIFNILALIYYNTGQFAKAETTTKASAPFAGRMTPESAQKTLVNQGLAQAQLGKSAEASASFDQAARKGYPHAAELKRKMLLPR
jgi:hypothetical protein